MALWLVLKDFNGAVPGASEFTAVAQILDDTLVNVPALQASGCPMLPWTGTPAQVAARNAFLARNPASGSPLPSENLLDLLATFGAFGGGGGGVTGDPNSIVYEDPGGTAAITDPKLVAAPLDPFSRPQIRDYRSVAGVGPVFRQGAWQADGDPTSQKAEGEVIYGANALGIGPSPADGGYARIKPDRLGLAQIIGGGPLTYYWRMDPIEFFAKDDVGSIIAQIVRQGVNLGKAFFKELHITSLVGPKIVSGLGSPETVVTGSPGDLYLNTAGGAGTTLYVKESGAATSTGWIGK